MFALQEFDFLGGRNRKLMIWLNQNGLDGIFSRRQGHNFPRRLNAPSDENNILLSHKGKGSVQRGQGENAVFPDARL